MTMVMLRIINFRVLSELFIIITSRVVVDSSANKQVNFTSRYDGRNVTASLQSSVTFTWYFTGEARKASWGTKQIGSNSIDENLFTLRESGSDGPQVALYKDRVNGSWSPKSPGQVSFTITDIVEDDNRIFICILQPKSPSASPVLDTVQLVVQGVPAVIVTPPFQSSGTGVDATFACNASGFPVPNIEWKRKVRFSEIEIKDDNGKYQVNSRSGSSELIIKNATSDDRGYYICEASNFKSDKAKTYLAVFSLYVDEDLCPKIIDATIGESRTICCPVRGHPPPDIFWEVPDGKSRYSDDITLPIVLETDNDFGGYRCLARGLEEEIEHVVTVRKIVLEPITHNGTIVLKPGDMFTWEKVQGAQGYMLRINETNFTKATALLISGNILSAEIPHSSLVSKNKNADEIPPNVTVIIEVVPIGVRGRQNDYTVEIHAGAITLAVSSMTLLLSFVFYNLQ